MFHLTAPRSFEAAQRDLSHSRPEARVRAVQALAGHAPEHRAEVVRALEQALGEQEPSAEVRAAAALGLADAKAVEAVPALIRAADDSHANVRQMALAALGELEDERGLEVVRAALDHEDPALRFQAVMAFARLCPDRAATVAALVAATEDNDPMVCHVALRMAEVLGPEPAPQGGAPKAEVPPVAPELLARAEALLGHDSALVRVASAIILARAGRTEGDGVLVRVAARQLKTPELEDEAAAVELCGSRALSEAVPALEARAFGGRFALRQDELAWQARVALLAMQHPRAVGWALGELKARSKDRVALAVAAVGRARLEQARAPLGELRARPDRVDPDVVEQALAALDAPEDP